MPPTPGWSPRKRRLLFFALFGLNRPEAPWTRSACDVPLGTLPSCRWHRLGPPPFCSATRTRHLAADLPVRADSSLHRGNLPRVRVDHDTSRRFLRLFTQRKSSGGSPAAPRTPLGLTNPKKAKPTNSSSSQTKDQNYSLDHDCLIAAERRSRFEGKTKDSQRAKRRHETTLSFRYG